MRRPQDLAVARPLSPVIGSSRGAPSASRWRSVSLHWRPLPPDRAFPVLNLAIRPLWRLDLAIAPVRHEHFHVEAVLDRDATPHEPKPRYLAYGIRTEMLWRRHTTSPEPYPDNRRAAPGAFPALPSASPGAPRRASALPGFQDSLRHHSWPASQPPHGRTRPRSVMLHRAQDAPIRMPTPAAGAPFPGWARGGRLVETDLPLRRPTRSIVPALRSAPSRLARMPVGRAASPVRAAVPLEAAPPRRFVTVIRPAAVNLAWRSSAPAPVRRRAPAETAWAQPATSQREPQIDLAMLARALGAGGAVAATPSSARSAATREMVQQVGFPDTGRLVDEVMERLDRRLRSDRLRRGL